MPITRKQASSTNEGEEDTLQRLLRPVALLQVRSNEQSRLSAEAKERHCMVEECHLEAIRAVERREEELHQQISAVKARDEHEPNLREESSAQSFWRQPFCEEVDETPIPPNFREVVMDPFDGTQDPYAHLQAFQTQMYISGTLRGVAMHWMTTLPTRSIRTFSDLVGLFLSQFVANKTKRMEVANLFVIKQSRGESLKNYLARFNNATVRVDDSDQKFFVKAFQKGLKVGPFSDALALQRLTSMEEIRVQVEKYVEMEESQAEQLEVERTHILAGSKHSVEGLAGG
ncbi:hypothetical protein CR513_24311, partial [Mucuna pruriens]